jgi:AraC family transcriptional regulator
LAEQGTLCIWPDVTVYRGAVPAADVHAHYPMTVAVPVSARATLGAEVEGLRLSTAGVVVRSGAWHCLEPGVPVIMLLLGACTPLGLRLRGFLAGRAARPLPPLAADPLRDLGADRREESRASVTTACGSFATLLEPGSRPVLAPRLIDAMMEVQRTAREETLTLDAIAASVALSPSRLRALFHGQAETSFRQYRRWFRLSLAIRAGLDGARLRDAAHEAGFADQAHFTRTCRSSFGLSPADLVRIASAGQTLRALATSLPPESPEAMRFSP